MIKVLNPGIIIEAMPKILKIENGQIRSVFDEVSKKIFYSIVDSVGIASGSDNPRNYWKVLKNRLKKSQNKLVTECNQLKIKSRDDKFYLTDCAEADIIIKIVEIISPDDIPSFWRYFDNNLEIMSKNTSIPLSFLTTTKNPTSENKLSYPQLNLEESEIPEFNLLVDAYTENNFIVVKAFTAGVDVKNISVHATQNSITISGSRTSPLTPTQNLEAANDGAKELSWGKFSRTLSLPQDIKEREIKVEEREDGLLIIKLPLLNKNQNNFVKKVVRMRTI